MAMNESEDFSKLASIKKCPICGGELEKGYIGAHEGVTWNSNKRKYLGVMLWRVYSVFLNIPCLKM